jgi:hypothetical protein
VGAELGCTSELALTRGTADALHFRLGWAPHRRSSPRRLCALRGGGDCRRSAAQRLREERQALVHPVIDTAMVVGRLLVAMSNPELVQPSHEPVSAVEQVELILLATVM